MGRAKPRQFSISTVLKFLMWALVGVYLCGMFTIFYWKGKQAAESLTINFEYDGGDQRQQNYIVNTMNAVERLMNLSSDELDKYIIVGNIPGIDLFRQDLEESMKLFQTIRGNYASDPEYYSNSYSHITELMEELADIKNKSTSFMAEVEQYREHLEKDDAIYLDGVLAALETTCTEIETFEKQERESHEDLFDNGNLYGISGALEKVEKETISLSVLAQNAADYLYGDRDKDGTIEALSYLSGNSDLLHKMEVIADSFSQLASFEEKEGYYYSIIEQEANKGDVASILETLDLLVTGKSSLDEVVDSQNHNLELRARLSRDTEADKKWIPATREQKWADYILVKTPLFGTIVSADGKYLWGPLPETSENENAWSLLIGEGNTSLTNDRTFTFTVSDAYKKQLLGEVKYSPWKGLSSEYNQIRLTIPSSVQENMYQYMKDNQIEGCIFAYNPHTGDILCMVSNSSDYYTNMCLWNTSPGSTMKMLTTLLLLNEGVDLDNLYYSCDADDSRYSDFPCMHLNENGENVDYGHGVINGYQAIGLSCNRWFAQAIEEYLMTDDSCIRPEVQDLLQEMGYIVKTEPAATDDYVELDNMRRVPSCIIANVNNPVDAIWNLIGEQSVMMSPIDMAQLAGLYAASSEASNWYARPAHLVQSSEAAAPMDFSEKHDALVYQGLKIWKEAYEYAAETDPVYSRLNSSITVAKTGTTELDNSGKNSQRTLIGFSDEDEVAFFIAYRNYKVDGKLTYSPEEESVASSSLIADIANKLMKEIEAVYE